MKVGHEVIHHKVKAVIEVRKVPVVDASQGDSDGGGRDRWLIHYQVLKVKFLHRSSGHLTPMISSCFTFSCRMERRLRPEGMRSEASRATGW